MTVALVFALLASVQAFAAMPEWQPDLRLAVEVPEPGIPNIVLVRSRPRRSANALRRKPAAAEKSRPVFIADAATWQKLVDRARAAGILEIITVGGVDYRYRILETSTAAPGQKCPAGTVVANAFFVFEGVPQQPGDQLYPARVSAECVADFGAPDALSVDADVDGRILNTDLIRSGSVAAEHPTFDPGNNSTENVRLKTLLKDLVSLFLRGA